MEKERINYIKNENGSYTGCSVNLPMIVGQAKSLEDLKKSMKEMGLVVLEDLTKLFNQDEPFELKELTKEEWYK